MKTLIVADIHGNWPALEAVLAAEAGFKEVVCLGDLVNYGPQPVECVEWAMKLGPESVVIQGNHDQAFACDEEPHCTMGYQVVASAVQAATSHLLTPKQRRFLAKLEPMKAFEHGGARCLACHATPGDPLYRYLAEEGGMNLWESELVRAAHPDFLFLGHTHKPMKTQFQRTLVVNPGSVGQPRDGDWRAAYAVWEDGRVTLRRAAYDVERTIQAYAGLALESHIVEKLSGILRGGTETAGARASLRPHS